MAIAHVEAQKPTDGPDRASVGSVAVGLLHLRPHFVGMSASTRMQTATETSLPTLFYQRSVATCDAQLVVWVAQIIRKAL